METNVESSRIEMQKKVGSRHALLGAACLALSLCASGIAANVASAQETRGDEIRDELHEARATRWHHPRLRLGISGLGGGFVGPTHGGVGGLALRVGVQLNDIVAIYLQGQGLLGEYVPDPRPSSIVGFAFHSAMVEFTLLDMIQLGAGPSIDVIWGCNETNAGGAYCGRSGAFFGGDFRVAIIAGHRGVNHRSGVTFSIDAHPTWVGDLMGTIVFGIGGEMY